MYESCTKGIFCHEPSDLLSADIVQAHLEFGDRRSWESFNDHNLLGKKANEMACMFLGVSWHEIGLVNDSAAVMRVGFRHILPTARKTPGRQKRFQANTIDETDFLPRTLV